MKKPNYLTCTTKASNQPSSNQALHKSTFIIGDLYLFHTMKKYCPSRSSLWGIYDKTEDGIVYLESSTLDLVHFKIWHHLPDGYRYWRRATRSELRDYMYNLGYRDSQLQHISANPQLSTISLQFLFILPRVLDLFPRDSIPHCCIKLGQG